MCIVYSAIPKYTFLHPSIRCFVGSAPVGVQCPRTSSCYWDWLWYTGISQVLVSIAFPFAFPSPSISQCFPFPLLHLSLDFICFFSRWRYLHLTTNPPPLPGLGIGTCHSGPWLLQELRLLRVLPIYPSQNGHFAFSTIHQ